MKIAILETAHFQYALTLSEIFSDCEKVFIATHEFKKKMLEYAPELCNGKMIGINSIAENANQIIETIQNEKIDLFLISPVFDSYKELNKIVKVVNCKKVVTIHNINTWFYGRFWSINSFMDRKNMRSIIKNCDYVAVEDFIYNYLKGSQHKLYRRHKFIYIPFTIFTTNKEKKYVKESVKLKIVLTGALDGARRRYEEILEVIEFFGPRNNEVTFSFAGRPYDDYGHEIVKKLEVIKKNHSDYVSYFDDTSSVEMFRREMETSDIVLSTSTKTFRGMGTTEYIGKTKPTAAIHDMMSYQLPGLLPSHLDVPHNLKGSVFNYTSAEDLIRIINSLIEKPSILEQWKMKAKENSLNFTAEKIRKGLPF